MKYIRLIFRIIAMMFHVLVSCIIIVIVLPAKVPVGSKLCKRQLFLMQLSTSIVLKIAGIKVDFKGSIQPEANLFLSNHLSWIDIPLISSFSPASFVAKYEIKNWFLLGAICTRFRSIYIRRGMGAKDVSKMVCSNLTNKVSTVIFPEGRIYPDFKVRNFFSRLLSGVENENVTVQPIAISYPKNGKGNTMILQQRHESLVQLAVRIMKEPSTNVILHYLDAFNAEGMTRDDLVKKAHKMICNATQKSYPNEIIR